MEELKAREESGRPWDLQTDKSLLKALQDLSGDMMASIQGLEDKLSSLEKSARSLSLRAGTAAVNFNEACQTQLIQQVVETPRGHQHGPGETSKPQLLTSSNFQEVVYPKYEEALELACLAFEHKEDDAKRWKPLPHIFGSPEYLQDATFGIGTFANEPADMKPAEAEQQTRQEDHNLTASNRSDIPDESTEPEAPSDVLVPDFKSMLEAALRGELDEGLGEDLMREASLSSQDSFTSAQAAEDVHKHEEASSAGSPEPSSSKWKEDLQSWQDASVGAFKSPSSSKAEQTRGSGERSRSRQPGEKQHTDSLLDEASTYDRATSEHLDLGDTRSDVGERQDSIGGEGGEPSLHALLNEQGDLFSDD